MAGTFPVPCSPLQFPSGKFLDPERIEVELVLEALLHKQSPLDESRGIFQRCAARSFCKTLPSEKQSPLAGYLICYDIERKTKLDQYRGHSDDINTVSYLNETSDNVFLTGSDDCLACVWDRREGPRPALFLTGHTGGITSVASLGDGRYALSNGKDSVCRLWDLRRAVSGLPQMSSGAKDLSVQT